MNQTINGQGSVLLVNPDEIQSKVTLLQQVVTMPNAHKQLDLIKEILGTADTEAASAVQILLEVIQTMNESSQQAYWDQLLYLTNMEVVN